MAENGRKATDRRGDRTEKKGTVAPGATEVRTSDAGIDGRSSGPSPERAAAFQTLGLSAPETTYPMPGNGGVVRGDDNDPHHPQEAKKKLERVERKMPRWPALLATCVLALVCGVGGAWAYAAVFGESQSDQQGKSGKGEKDGTPGDEKSGGSPPHHATDSKVEKQVEELTDGIDQLGTRIDRLNQAMQESRQPVPKFYPGTSRIERMAPANDDSPPAPHALQTQLMVLQRKVDQMADLSARVTEIERQVTEVREAIKLLAETRTTE